MLLQCKRREVRSVMQVGHKTEISRNPICHGARSGSSINGDAIDTSCSNSELGVSFCRGSTVSRLVVGER